jgi:hypothetical protein
MSPRPGIDGRLKARLCSPACRVGQAELDRFEVCSQ